MSNKTMDEIPYHPLVIVTQEDMKKVRAACDVNDVKRIRDSLNVIDEWLQKQPHLAEAGKYIRPSPAKRDVNLIRESFPLALQKFVDSDFKHFDSVTYPVDYLSKEGKQGSRAILERIFILAKGSVEGTKNRLERMLTSRGMMPELSMNRTVEEFEPHFHIVHYVPLPKLHPVDQSRVMVTQFLTGKLEDFSLLSYFRYCFMVGEYRLNFDYSPSERYIIDMKNIHIGLLSKINPVVVKKSEVLCTEGIGTKIKGIHILNAPPFVDKVVFLLKQALREKVANRVHVHPNYEDLHKHVPKEILPKDYDGDDQPVVTLNEKWNKTLMGEEARRLIKETDKLISDESKRTAIKFNEEYLGMPGSFRRLTVD